MQPQQWSGLDDPCDLQRRKCQGDPAKALHQSFNIWANLNDTKPEKSPTTKKKVSPAHLAHEITSNGHTLELLRGQCLGHMFTVVPNAVATGPGEGKDNWGMKDKDHGWPGAVDTWKRAAYPIMGEIAKSGKAQFAGTHAYSQCESKAGDKGHFNDSPVTQTNLNRMLEATFHVNNTSRQILMAIRALIQNDQMNKARSGDVTEGPREGSGGPKG